MWALYDDVSLLVFSYLIPRELVRLRAVCKYFKGLVDTSFVWRHLTPCPYSRVTDGKLPSLAAGLPFLRSLRLVYCQNITASGIAATLSGLPQLERLTLGYLPQVHIGSEIEEIMDACPDSLTALDLKDLPGVNNVVLIAVASHLGYRLRHLNISNSSVFSLVHLVRLCGSLHSLSIERCVELKDNSIAFFLRNSSASLRHFNVAWTAADALTFSELEMAHSKLKTLRCFGCNFTNDDVGCLSNKPDLTSLNLGYTYLSDEGIELLVNCVPQLTELDVSGCENVTPAGVELLKKRCPQLRRLVCHDIGEAVAVIED